MRGGTQRERLLVRAARRVEGGAPARLVCRDLGIAEAELAAWRWNRAPEVLWLAGRASDLEWENRRLKAALAALQRHRSMLIEVFNLAFPTPPLRSRTAGEAVPTAGAAM
jgi:hypothetical protein